MMMCGVITALCGNSKRERDDFSNLGLVWYSFDPSWINFVFRKLFSSFGHFFYISGSSFLTNQKSKKNKKYTKGQGNLN